MHLGQTSGDAFLCTTITVDHLNAECALLDACHKLTYHRQADLQCYSNEYVGFKEYKWKTRHSNAQAMTPKNIKPKKVHIRG